MQTVRCGHCGLAQLRQESCKRCGRPFADDPSPVRRPGHTAPPSRWRSYLTVWTQPRATMRRILDADPQRAVILLAWLRGIADAFESGSFKSSSDYPWPFFVGLALVMGPPVGFVRIYLGGALMAVAGRWLGGSGDTRDCRAALAWSSVPLIAGLALWPLAIAVFGNEIFHKNTPRLDDSLPLLAVLLALGVVWVVLHAWSAVVRWKCLGEAHGFSAWRGFVTEAIVVALFVALLVAAVIVVIALDVFPSPRPSASPGH